MAKAQETPARADIVIAGAGIAGLALARALAAAPGAALDIVVVGPPLAPVGPAPRAIALSRGAVAMLGTLGIWAGAGPHAQAMERIVVSDGHAGGTQLSLLEFSDDGGEGAQAHIIEETALAAAVAAAACSSANVTLVDGRIDGVAAGPGTVAMRLADGGEIAAGLAVGADGARSPVRSGLGIRTVGWDYGQSAIVATIEHTDAHHGVAVERFLPAGPFAILPLTGRRSSIVWTEPAGEAARLMKAGEAEFASELTLRFGAERGAVTGIGARATFPLAFHIARRFIAQRAALIGDAAHVVHPLAGQGLNLALRDVAALAEAVVEARRLGLDHGAADVLERYERWRRFDTIASALAYDGLNRLFASDNDAVRTLRGLGLGLVDRIAPLKRAFMREAAGLAGAVPRLMAGKQI